MSKHESWTTSNGNGDSAKRKSLNTCVRHFTPAWFSAIMGTGAISLLIHGFPYHEGSQTAKLLALIVFFLDLVLFAIFCCLSALRYIWYPEVWGLMLHHPAYSLYLGTFPMGATTLITISVDLVYTDYGFGGKSFLYALWALWWLDIAVSVGCTWGLVHIMKTRHCHTLETMSATWLLPVVTLIVAASSGGILALALHEFSPSAALVTITASAFVVVIGLTLAFMMLGIYLLRLILHGLPPGPGIMSAFIPLGPMGQAGYAALLIGQAFESFLPLPDEAQGFLARQTTGEVLNVLCICVAFILWSLASMWIIYAVLAIYEVVRKSIFPFKVSFWGLIFPNGVYANLTVRLYQTFNSQFFRVWGVIYSVATIVLWSWVFIRTMTLTYDGSIFKDPYLEDVDMDPIVQTQTISKRNDRDTSLKEESTRFASTQLGLGEGSL